jgi:hypothetical protein
VCDVGEDELAQLQIANHDAKAVTEGKNGDELAEQAVRVFLVECFMLLNVRM